MADSTKCIDRGECRGGKCIPFCETQDLQVRSINIYTGYGNTGCQVFQAGGTKLERFLPKNQHT